MRTWFAAACVLAAAPAFAQMPAVVNGTLESRPLTQTVEREIGKKAVFALSQLPKDEGVPKLIAVAGTHRDSTVRRQAISGWGSPAIRGRSRSSNRCFGISRAERRRTLPPHRAG